MWQRLFHFARGLAAPGAGAGTSDREDQEL
jgi:hypothetical protein